MEIPDFSEFAACLHTFPPEAFASMCKNVEDAIAEYNPADPADIPKIAQATAMSTCLGYLQLYHEWLRQSLEE